MWKAALAVFVVICALAVGWVSLWLWNNTVFANPALLEAKDALAAEAAWTQALLSVLAVLVAVGVARHQAQQSRALIEAERLRLRDIESRESFDRQALVASCLQETQTNLELLAEEIKKNRVDEAENLIWRVSASSRSALKALSRVFPVLSVTANGALMSYRIELELERLSSMNSYLHESLYDRDDVMGDVRIKPSFLHKDICSAVELINRARTVLIVSTRGL